MPSHYLNGRIKVFGAMDIIIFAKMPLELGLQTNVVFHDHELGIISADHDFIFFLGG